MMTRWRFKRLAVLVVPALILLGIRDTGAQVSGQANKQLEANKRTVRQLFEAVWNEANFVGLELLWAAQVPFHFRGQADLVGPRVSGLRWRVGGGLSRFSFRRRRPCRGR